MNVSDSVFKAGAYEIFPDDMLFNIYYIKGMKAELMVGGFFSLAEAIDYLLHPKAFSHERINKKTNKKSDKKINT